MGVGATLLVGVVSASAGALLDGGGADRHRPDPAYIRVVRGSRPAMPVWVSPASSPSPVKTVTGKSAIMREKREWDDVGAALGEMAARIRGEERDTAWSGTSEAALTTRLARIVPRRAPPAAVRCATTFCEIVGVLPSSISDDEVAATLQSLQGTDVRNALPDAMLVGGPGIANGNGGKRYVMYFRRQAN